MPALQEILQRNQTTLTEEEMKVKAARKVASALKSKATRARNKEKAISDRVTAVLSTQTEVPNESDTITAPTNVISKADKIPSKKTNKREVASLVSSLVTDHNPSQAITKEISSTVNVKDYDKFLRGIDSTKYTWEYISLDGNIKYDGQLAKVQPNEENNNITTLAVIINEDEFLNRRARDPRFFKVRMFNYKNDHIFPQKYLLVTKSKERIK